MHTRDIWCQKWDHYWIVWNNWIRMEQITLEQIMGFLKANQQKMDADKAESKAKRKADREMTAEMMAGLKRMNAKMDAWLGKTEACLEEEKEPAPEELKAVEEPQDVPIGATDEEAIRATEDRAGELCLVLRRHSQRKKWAQEKGEPRQKFAAFRGRFTRHAVPALLKGHVHKGPRRNRRSGVRGPGKTSRRIDGRSLRERQIKGNVEQGTPRGRTCEKRRRTRLECHTLSPIYPSAL
jgi:hypothetical protein